MCLAFFVSNLEWYQILTVKNKNIGESLEDGSVYPAGTRLPGREHKAQGKYKKRESGVIRIATHLLT